MRMTPDMLWARVLSKSYISAMNTEQQAKVKQDTEEIVQRHHLAEHAAGQQDGMFDCVVKTEVFICQRRD